MMINKICALLKNKKILILGYGREGKSSYQFIRKHFPEMVVGVYDKNEIKDSLQNVIIYRSDTYQEFLQDYDMVIKSPGIVLKDINSQEFEKVTSQTDIFLEFYRDQTIGITGTKGKSTTASLLYHVLHSVGKDAILVGNIGIPVFDMLEKINEGTLVVYELSSHQLEYATHSPHIGLYLNIYQEHLDHYGTFEKYATAKENIYKYQQKGDLFIYNNEFIDTNTEFEADIITISSSSDEADIQVKEDHICYQGDELHINEEELQLKGQHNVKNIGAAYGIAKVFGVSEHDFYEAVKTFKPLPHRLEYVTEVEGVKYFNDSISTICETTIQAVKSIKNIDTLILGGMDRGIEYEPLVEFLMGSEIRNIILMPDTGLRIHKLILSSDIDHKDKNIIPVTNLEEAVAIAKKETMRGKTCLFSPAAASYGFFKNFEERGEVFKKFLLN
jgi:UDP-N-acetylmuramoylalanine--D-glutamate ligase